RQFYEHEVYRLIELAGAASAPCHRFVPAGEQITADILSSFPGDKVVLKLVSAEVVHKTEAGAVVFVAKEIDAVQRAVEQLLDRCRDKQVEGILIVEFVEQAGGGFGRELFVGIRATREFGPVIAAGLGGVNTEYFAQKMKPSVAVAKALALDTSAEEFLELFKGTAAYDVISGRVRGQSRIVTDAVLLRCFRAFIAIARRFGADRCGAGPELGELEVNPFTFVRKQLIPLDGRGQLTPAAKNPVPRPFAKVQNLLEPRSIAVMGVSAKRANFGRIILNNVCSCGFPREHLYVVKEGLDEVDGIRCVPTVDQLPEAIDLLVVATSAAQVPEAIDAVIDSQKVATVILIPGGVGETEGSEALKDQVCQRILASRAQKDGGPIFIGPNSMGIRSRPGNYDTFFIPASKLDPRRQIPPRRAAIVSQSGAFIITRLSNVASLDPALAVSLGNQLDVTVSDVVRNVGDRDDIDCIGVYVEGFNDLDGLAFARAVREITKKSKLVVFYKAGRTAPGRAATAGHTASVAGDYDVCEAAVTNAGGVVAGTFKEFEQLVELGTALHDKDIGGCRLGAISNAGFETVGMADNILGERYAVEMPKLSEATANKIANHLREFRIDTLVNARNPLDLTPMANEAAFAGCIRAMLDDPGIDALIVSAVPLTPQLLTTAKELEKPGSLAEILPELLSGSSKPLVAVIDSGDRYEPLVNALRTGGVPTFRSADQAVRALGRYLCHRVSQGGSKVLTSASRKKGEAPRQPKKTPA
ncbi:MAG: acetate--CoA ligase family protein, partial [Planctomycetes bacterium]|nr:acetate--CoA ligase family protein [Planctomycetota bacterium]